MLLLQKSQFMFRGGLVSLCTLWHQNSALLSVLLLHDYPWSIKEGFCCLKKKTQKFQRDLEKIFVQEPSWETDLGLIEKHQLLPQNLKQNLAWSSRSIHALIFSPYFHWACTIHIFAAFNSMSRLKRKSFYILLHSAGTKAFRTTQHNEAKFHSKSVQNCSIQKQMGSQLFPFDEKEKDLWHALKQYYVLRTSLLWIYSCPLPWLLLSHVRTQYITFHPLHTSCF